MNLEKLFQIQAGLDQHIIREKGLEGQDLLPKKILALQVELGELCQEWRGFKFWSNDQEPRVKRRVACDWKNNEHGGIDPVHGTDRYKNPLLEEYVDCLHFILSIGLEIKTIQDKPVESFNYYGFKNPFGLTQAFSDLMSGFTLVNDEGLESGLYVRLFMEFLGIGEMLGFTEEQIEHAYLSKNKINHKRQEAGY
ncbi:dUTP diphosphatase [Terrihalobacillus insolitus]|uniref:dUTP diphosphatase n=1 Tax=Terrihalobacillus insolitus TaxID=2950438 RepID=UPI0023409FB5|nr:dUTP diphosphatase [Terrihalobacillus insolitus]MDC3414291.1 dUTP diphosphatase [Terrihalobacillus insolitus]